MSGGDSKTEQPTAKRLKESRDEGRIAKSQDISAWGSVLAGVMVIQMTFSRSSSALHQIMNEMGQLIGNPDINTALRFLGSSMSKALIAMAPLLGTFVILAIIINFAQVRFVLAFKAMKPSFKKINPISGIKRLLSFQSIWQAMKELLKLIVFGFIAYHSLYGLVVHMARGGPFAMAELINGTVNGVLVFVRQIAVAGLLIGFADYMYQRRKINKGIKMTKQEVKEEYKQQDSNPEVKNKMRARARQMSRNRMMQAIQDADVVVVNPVHIAIALKYDPQLGAPKVVAKGAGFVAEKIRDKADEHKIPMVQDIQLARALHKTCEVGDEIPATFFEAVAKVLALVFSLKRRGTSSGLHKMPGTPDLNEVEDLSPSLSMH